MPRGLAADRRRERPCELAGGAADRKLPVTSVALSRWTTIAKASLDEIASAHTAVRGSGAGRHCVYHRIHHQDPFSDIRRHRASADRFGLPAMRAASSNEPEPVTPALQARPAAPTSSTQAPPRPPPRPPLRAPRAVAGASALRGRAPRTALPRPARWRSSRSRGHRGRLRGGARLTCGHGSGEPSPTELPSPLDNHPAFIRPPLPRCPDRCLTGSTNTW